MGLPSRWRILDYVPRLYLQRRTDTRQPGSLYLNLASTREKEGRHPGLLPEGIHPGPGWGLTSTLSESYGQVHRKGSLTEAAAAAAAAAAAFMSGRPVRSLARGLGTYNPLAGPPFAFQNL